MNSKTTIIGLVAAIAVLSGAMGLSVTGAFSDQTIAQTTIPATGMLMGQVMIEAHNGDGELIAYRIGDNEVVDDGEQCILKMLFATSGIVLGSGNADGRGQYLNPDGTGQANTSNAACTGILTGAWDVIAVGKGVDKCGAAQNVACSTTALHDKLVLMMDEVVGDGLSRDYATTKTWQNGTGATETQIVLKKTFTWNAGDASAITVYESGLFNMTGVSGSGMLAHKTFAGVVLAENDSITVQWTFKVGN